MYKNIINFTIAAVIMLLPLTGMAAPQTTDIKKPTRERVKEKDDKKNANDKKATNDKKESNDKKANNDKKEGTKDNKTPTTVKKEATPTEKPGDTKPADANQNVQKTVVDTANKNAAPPKPKKVPMYPDKVQFDGIDISKHQGEIDWAELKKQSKIQYVYIRATVGSNVIDNKYKENFRNARKHGFKAGSYHYFTNLSSATAQFENFIKTVDRNSQDLLPIIDVEEINRWSKQQLRDSVMVFAQLVEDYFGCKPLIYTNEKFFTTNLGRAFAEYPLFIAKYSTTAPNIGYNWVLWQFSDCGQFKSSVKGNHGEVDLSRFNKGRSINDILYVPSKHKPKKVSAMDAVEQKEKPVTVKMTEQKPKEAPKTTKRQQDDKKQAEKEKKLKERNQKAADELAKKKAEEQRKAKEKEEQRKKAEQQKKAREDAAKKAEAEKQRKKAEAKQARQDKAKRDAASKSNKPASLMQSSASKLSQSQRNDSIRNAKLKGQKINKSTPDND